MFSRKSLFLLLIWVLVGFSGRGAAAEPGKTDEKRFAIWAQPVSTLVGAIPIGANLPLGNKASLGLELTYAQLSYGENGRGRARHWLAAIGPIFSSSGKPLASGVFFQPKFLAVYSNENSLGGDLMPGGQSMGGHVGGESLNIQLAVDVGYQLVWGHFFFGSFLGLGAGYGFNVQKPYLLFALDGASSAPRSNLPTFSVNLNLIRVGVAF